MCVSRQVMFDSATPLSVACQSPLSVEFSKQEHWRGLPFPSLGNLPNPGIELQSPTLRTNSLPSEPYITLYIFLMPEIHRALSLIWVSASHWRLEKHLSFSVWQNHKTTRDLPKSFGLSTLGISHQKEMYPPMSKSSFKHCVIIMYYQDIE